MAPGAFEPGSCSDLPTDPNAAWIRRDGRAAISRIVPHPEVPAGRCGCSWWVRRATWSTTVPVPCVTADLAAERIARISSARSSTGDPRAGSGWLTLARLRAVRHVQGQFPRHCGSEPVGPVPPDASDRRHPADRAISASVDLLTSAACQTPGSHAAGDVSPPASVSRS